MPHYQLSEHCELKPDADWDFFGDAQYHERIENDVVIRPPATFRQALGDEPIRLGVVEFQVMRLLVSRPYYAFSRRQISDAVLAECQPLLEESVDAFITSLRSQLGVLHDYVQSVPYVGYRFKP